MIETQAGFFTHHPQTLSRQLDSLLGTTQREIDPDIVVAPYGTLGDIGSICGDLYGSLSKIPNSVVFLGANESRSSTIAYPGEDIATPIGDITIDNLFRQRMEMSDAATVNNTAFSISRSLLPHIAFLKHINPDLKLSPILLSLDADQTHRSELETVLNNLMTPEDLLIVSGRLARSRVTTEDETRQELQRIDSGFLTEMRQRHRASLLEYGREHRIDLATPVHLALGLRGVTRFNVMAHRTWVDDEHDRVGGCTGFFA